MARECSVRMLCWGRGDSEQVMEEWGDGREAV